MPYTSTLITFTAGFLVGGLFLYNAKTRPLLRLFKCSNYLSKSEIAGLFASVLVQTVPRLIPKIIAETDKTIVFEHPWPKHEIHYMFVPKKDIRDIGELTDEDKEYLIDLFSTVTATINKTGIRDYSLWTNGPGRQDVTYLHFHLGGKLD